MHSEIQEFTRRLVQMVVDRPEAVEVTVDSAEIGAVYLTIRVAAGEVGKVVGENGDLIKSIQLLANAVGTRFERRVNLHVEELNGPQIASTGQTDSPRGLVQRPRRI